MGREREGGTFDRRKTHPRRDSRTGGTSVETRRPGYRPYIHSPCTQDPKVPTTLDHDQKGLLGSHKDQGRRPLDGSDEVRGPAREEEEKGVDRGPTPTSEHGRGNE